MNTLELIFWISLFILFYTYLGYGILLFFLVKIKELFTKPKVYPCDELPDVTLFVAAYNEEKIVHEKMENIHALHYPKEKLHLVWCTDGSNDRTNELLANYPDAKVLFQPLRQGKTAALNRGVPLLSTSIVVFTDANTMLNKEAIYEIARCFCNPNVGCVAGEKRIAVKETDGAAAGGEGLYWKYESLLKKLDSRLCTAVGAAGELFAIRREFFQPMPNDTLLDDFILSLRIAMQGYKIEYCDKAYAEESGSADMKEEEKRKVRISAGGLQSILRLKSLLNPFAYGCLSFQYISHRVLRWSLAPILLFFFLPLHIATLLTSENPLYGQLFLLQILFYVLGLWGYYLSTKQIKNKFLYIPYYFLFMNINVIRGFNYLRKKRGSGVWEKATRA
ncbi:MAG: glycosyltransferase family 2 protein [Bacteroidaceae bacterium]